MDKPTPTIAAALAATTPDGLPPRQRAFAFLAIAIAVTMAVLDTAIVNVALPSISQALAVDAAQAVWVVNAYQLAVTVSLLPLAALGDRLGYKRVYWGGLAVFTLASLACARAPTLALLAGARVVQGLGAAGIMSVNIALVRSLFPKAQLGVGMGYASLTVAVSSAAGPTLAAAVLAVADWKWLFLINVPLGAIALLVAALALPASPTSRRRIDTLSVLLNALTFGPLIGGLGYFGEAGGAQRGGALVAVGLACGAALLRRERRSAHPVLPLDLLRLPVFVLSLATSIGAFAAQTMALIALPFYFERTLGMSETATGLLMTPWPLATALVAPLAGRLSDRFAPGRLCIAGMLCLAAGLAGVAALGGTPDRIGIAWRLAVCGLGFGLFQSPNNRVIMGSAPRERSGGASGLQALGRLLGQSLGAVAAALLFALGPADPTAALATGAASLALLAAGTSAMRRKPAT